MTADSPDLASMHRVVLVTVPDAEAGRELARQIGEDRLAACGNVIPGLTSVYRWEGTIQEDQEALVLFKTTEGVLGELKRRVLELHSYEVPEFLALSVTEGNEAYLRWLDGEVDGFGASP